MSWPIDSMVKNSLLEDSVSNAFVNSIIIQIRHCRESRNLSQPEMAKALGIGLRTYQRIESGDTLLTIDVLYKLSSFLELPIEHLADPASHLPENDAYYGYEDLEHFLTNEDVQNSQIVELSNHPQFIKSLEENNLEQLTGIEEFYLSKYPLSVSDPKWTILNIVAQKKLKSHLARVPTYQGHQSQERLGKIWGIFVKENIKYFKDSHTPSVGSGELTVNSVGIFLKSKSNYFILCYLK